MSLYRPRPPQIVRIPQDCRPGRGIVLLDGRRRVVASLSAAITEHSAAPCWWVRTTVGETVSIAEVARIWKRGGGRGDEEAVKRTGREFSDGTVKCPFCGFATDARSTNPACGGCFVEFFRNRRGEIVFDTKRTTAAGLAHARARCFSGVRLGRISGESP